MTGITGGTVGEAQLERMVDRLGFEEWYTSERFEASGYGIGAQHHGETDPLGHTFWSDGRVAGAIDGAVSNRRELGWDDEALFRRLLRAPQRTLSTLEGPFTIACFDAADDRVLLATDKIGSRPCYYSTADGFAFGSGLPPLLAVLDDPELDPQGISDLLLIGGMWSDTTLLEGVKSVRPATLLEYSDDELAEQRYWQPNYDPVQPSEEYFHELTCAFEQTIDRMARSAKGDIGLWLSGGLDSRSTMSELARNYRNGSEFDSLTAYTYDANPGGGVNPRLAQRVADTLELPIEQVELTPDSLLSVLEKGVTLTDGMISWNTFSNLAAVFNIERYEPDIMMEGVVGELFGQHLSRSHLTDASSLVESMYRSEASLPETAVTDLLDVSVDPFGSFRREARRVDESTFEGAVVDIHFQNYYPRFVHASNPIARSQVGTRVPYADGQLLKCAARLPLSYRMGTLPFSDDLIYGVVKPKIRMIRALNTELAEIPYERSRLKPSYPYILHVAGFFISTAIAQLKSQPTYGGRSLNGEWYRSHDAFRETIDGLLDDALERPYFDADTVEERRQRHLAGESNEMTTISAVTTLEMWVQRHLD
jgi:asparagine synthase (glutamine-hydrolysing)